MILQRSRRATALLLSLSSLPLAALAEQAPPPAPLAWYAGAHVGTNMFGTLGAQVDLAKGKSYAGEATFKRGAHGGAFVGRRSEHARVELELASGRVRLTHLAAGPVDADANATGRYRAAFANVYRTERLSDALEVFAGAGVGWGRTDLRRLGLLRACTCFGPASGKGFAWQLRAGAAFHVDALSSVAVQYSSVHLQPLESDRPPQFPHVLYDRKAFGAWTVAWNLRF